MQQQQKQQRERMVQMGLRSGSPGARDRDDDQQHDQDFSRHKMNHHHPPPPPPPPPPPRNIRRHQRHLSTRYATPSSRLIGSVQELAGNFAAGVQRFGFHCGFPWGRETRKKPSPKERFSRSPPLSEATSPVEMEEGRQLALEQILQLSEQQICGKRPR